MNVNETIAVVTGGSSGIGEACVREIVSAGGHAAIWDLQEEKGRKIEAELGSRARFIRTDVTDDESVKKAIADTIQSFGTINVAINCAGIGGPCKVLGKNGPMSTAFFNDRIQVNLVGTMRVIIFAAEQD